MQSRPLLPEGNITPQELPTLTEVLRDMPWYIIAFVVVIVGLLIYTLYTAISPFCCGPRNARRIDVAYPPGIRIGLTGPWTANTDKIDRSFFDTAQYYNAPLPKSTKLMWRGK